MTFGRELQLEREKRGVSLGAIAERTRVPERFLDALEQEHFEQMPGGVFNKGILRSYCRDLGLDEEEWMDRFEAVAATEPDQQIAAFAENVKRNRTDDAPSGVGTRWWGVVLMLLVLGALAWTAWRYIVKPRTALRPGTPAQVSLWFGAGGVHGASADGRAPKDSLRGRHNDTGPMHNG